MKRITYFLFLFLSISVIAGCGSSTTVQKPLDLSQMMQGSEVKYVIGDITAKEKGKDAPEHFLSAVKGHLQAELSKRNLLNEPSEQSQYHVDIVVKYYRMRGTAAKILLGAFAGKDGVDSNITVTDVRTDEVVGQSDVSTYNITTVVTMEDLARLHAEEIARFLAGKKESQ